MSGTGKNNQELADILMKVAKLQHIRDFEITIDDVPSKTEGFLSELFTGVITNNDNGDIISVAIKMVPKQAGIFEDFTDTYKNEERFYSKIFPELDKFQRQKQVPEPFDQIPKYFFGSLESGKEHITMENIVTKGYRLNDKGSFFNKTHLELLFKTFGKFHALSFAFKDQNPQAYEQLLTNITDVFKSKDDHDIVYEAIAANVFGGLHVFSTVKDKDISEKLKKIENVQKVLVIVNNYKGNYKCIIHGDCWSNNLLFKHKESGWIQDVKFLDFQMIRESTPIHDLSFLFYSGASEEELSNIDFYLEVYYESFCNFAILLGSDPQKLYPLEVLKQDWRQYALLGVFLGFDLLVLKLIKPEKALEMRNMEEENKQEGLKMWDDEMARIRRTEEFRNRSKAIILHAIQQDLLQFSL